MTHILQTQYISTADIQVDVYRSSDGDRCRIKHAKLEIEHDCPLREIQQKTSEVTWEALERVTNNTSDAAKISPEVEMAIAELRSLDTGELQQLLSEPRADIVLLAVF